MGAYPGTMVPIAGYLAGTESTYPGTMLGTNLVPGYPGTYRVPWYSTSYPPGTYDSAFMPHLFHTF